VDVLREHVLAGPGLAENDDRQIHRSDAIGELDGGEEHRRCPEEPWIAVARRAGISPSSSSVSPMRTMSPDRSMRAPASTRAPFTKVPFLLPWSRILTMTPIRVDHRMLARQLWIVERDVDIRAGDPPETQLLAEIEATGDQRAGTGA